MIAIWNHDAVNDRQVITSGGNITVIGPGAMAEFEKPLADEILAEAKKYGVPFSRDPAGNVVVGGKVFVQPSKALMVPVAIFNRENLMRLDKAVLLDIVECIGAMPLEDDATPKRVIVDEILAVTQPKTISEDLTKANVPPTETGETNTAGVK